MTKAEMIKTIQETEHELKIQLKKDERAYGGNDIETQISLAHWAEIYRLMEKLGIKTITAENIESIPT